MLRKYRDSNDRMEWGVRIRKTIDRAFQTVYPYLRIVIPNFRVAHYFYIVSWIIVGSIMIYPVKNVAYIDALYFATGAATQSGLNTVDVNQLALWQQMCIYIITTLTTPIFIHGSLLFIRLYGFERFFDNIKETSRLNNRMRRAATLSSRTRSFDSARARSLDSNRANTRVNTTFNTGYNTDVNPNAPNPAIPFHKDEHSSDNTPPSSSTQEHDEKHNEQSSNVDNNDNNADNNVTISSDVEHITEPSSDEDRSSSPSNLTHSRPGHIQFPDELPLARTLSTRAKTQQVQIQAPLPVKSPRKNQNVTAGDGGIKFGVLPLPVKRNYEIDPKEMYKSIEMLQMSNKNHDEDDDVLVIKSPNQIENENGEQPIFTKKFPTIQFSDDNPLSKGKLRKKVRAKLKKMRTMSMNLIEDENRSIDSNDSNENANHRASDRDSDAVTSDEDVTEFEGDLEEEEDDDDEGEVDGEENDEDEDEEHRVTKSQSNLALPSADKTGGKKYAKRANTFDIGGIGGVKSTPSKPKKRKAKKQGKRIALRTMSRFSIAPRLTRSSTDEENSLFTSISHTLSNPLTRLKTANYLSWEPTLGRNSNFVHLTDEQKEELGGVEYRAIKVLIKIVTAYYVGFHIIAVLVYLGWILDQPNYKTIIRDYGLSPVWWGFFTGQTSFNDLGYTLTPNSMISFNNSLYVMIWGAVFIVIGNTGFPILLRFIIWILCKFATPMSLFEESLGFLLDHPRRCFTLLFPSGPTWWLFAILLILNGVDLIFFIILDLKNEYLETIPVGYRIMCGLYNAVSTRTAGLSVVDISQLHAAVQVGYVIMMYISVLPLAISIRRTNVYEEQSLGVYIKDPKLNHEEDVNEEKSPRNFVGSHLRNQLSFDLWFVFLGLFLICIAENGKLERDEIRFTVFTILFECVSAYGTVGLSLGYPTANTSFSGQFTTISKLILIAMMIRGRHRGLPYALDRAIMLPSDNMLKRDKVQEHHIERRNETMERSQTQASGGTFPRAATGTGTDLFHAISRRGNEILRRRMSSAGY